MPEALAISPPPWQSVEPAIKPINQATLCSILSADGRVVATVYQREPKEGAANLSLLRNAPKFAAFAEAFVEWAENHDGIFVWFRDHSQQLHADEGWRGLVDDASAALAEARGKPVST